MCVCCYVLSSTATLYALASEQRDRIIASSSWLQVRWDQLRSEKILTFIGSVTEGDVCLNILLNNNISTAIHKGNGGVALTLHHILLQYIFGTISDSLKF